jgi:toxin ParE1/3/4
VTRRPSLRIRYTRQAITDLDQAHAYIARENSTAAAAVANRIHAAIDSLRHLPARGRPGRVPGTRELVVPRTPFLVPYRVAGNHIDILAIMHAARAWPPQFD